MHRRIFRRMSILTPAYDLSHSDHLGAMERGTVVSRDSGDLRGRQRRRIRLISVSASKGVQLIISDACRGLVESVADFLPEARYQRSMVHFYCNVFSHVPSTRVGEVSHMLKAIHAQERPARPPTRRHGRSSTTSRMGKAADLVEQAVHETLPNVRWQQIRTNTISWNGL